MTLQGTNTYLVGTGRQRLLVDAGEGGVPGWRQGLAEVLEQEGCAVGALLLTHWHHDHVGGAGEVVAMAGEEEVAVYKWPRPEAEEPACLAGLGVLHGQVPRGAV
jgi:glyoxylase-like metal-dependent hydrolase (beta-lactamase superfamily II)